MHQMQEDQRIYNRTQSPDPCTEKASDHYPVAESGRITRFWRSTNHFERKARNRIKVFTWWNLFAIIGIITVIIQAIRYLVVPLLVYLNVLSGGVL